MRARLELLGRDQGGRHTPVFDRYRPDFRATTDGHGDVDLGAAEVGFPNGTAMVMPGTVTDVELTPADATRWADVTTGLVLGVLESDHQVGKATIL